MGRITLLTDFGTQDGFVGAMKGVLASMAPGAALDDIHHAVPPGDIRKAATVLARYWCLYPPDTVHLVVVDPGVGTGRRGLALRADERWLVGPDNGVLSLVAQEASAWEAVELRSSDILQEPASTTFHGRDLFAPAAALLARGSPLSALGPPLRELIRLPVSIPEEVWEEGEVVDVDRFGNLATNLAPEAVREAGGVEIAGRRVPLGRTYGDVASGALVAVVNSDGRVEVARRDGSAAEALGVDVGEAAHLLRASRGRCPTKDAGLQ